MDRYAGNQVTDSFRTYLNSLNSLNKNNTNVDIPPKISPQRPLNLRFENFPDLGQPRNTLSQQVINDLSNFQKLQQNVMNSNLFNALVNNSQSVALQGFVKNMLPAQIRHMLKLQDDQRHMFAREEENRVHVEETVNIFTRIDATNNQGSESTKEKVLIERKQPYSFVKNPFLRIDILIDNVPKDIRRIFQDITNILPEPLNKALSFFKKPSSKDSMTVSPRNSVENRIIFFALLFFVTLIFSVIMFILVHNVFYNSGFVFQAFMYGLGLVLGLLLGGYTASLVIQIKDAVRSLIFQEMTDDTQ